MDRLGDDERNPYVLLGVPFGASRDVATLAFARKARRAKRANDGGSLLTDLTWALNQVQEALKDPEAVVHLYRVPADPGVFEPDSEGVLRPSTERLGRSTIPDDEQRQSVFDAAVGELRSGVVAEYARSFGLGPR